MGLTGTNAELLSRSEDYTFTNVVAKPSPQEMMIVSNDLERADFVRNSEI